MNFRLFRFNQTQKTSLSHQENNHIVRKTKRKRQNFCLKQRLKFFISEISWRKRLGYFRLILYHFLVRFLCYLLSCSLSTLIDRELYLGTLFGDEVLKLFPEDRQQFEKFFFCLLNSLLLSDMIILICLGRKNVNCTQMDRNPIGVALVSEYFYLAVRGRRIIIL